MQLYLHPLLLSYLWMYLRVVSKWKRLPTTRPNIFIFPTKVMSAMWISTTDSSQVKPSSLEAFPPAQSIASLSISLLWLLEAREISLSGVAWFCQFQFSQIFFYLFLDNKRFQINRKPHKYPGRYCLTVLPNPSRVLVEGFLRRSASWLLTDIQSRCLHGYD